MGLLRRDAEARRSIDVGDQAVAATVAETRVLVGDLLESLRKLGPILRDESESGHALSDESTTEER